MRAIPPPLPVVRGALMIEKLWGQRLRSKDGSESEGSQVSERERMSTELSEMNSMMAAGLLISEVMVEADLMLKCDIHNEEGKFGQGPGLISISPARSSRMDESMVHLVGRDFRGERERKHGKERWG